VLVIALFLGAAAGLAVAPSFGAALGIGAALFVGLVLAALKWREWLFSPSARILRGGIAVVIVALLGYLAWDGNPVRLQLTMDRLTPLPPRGVESAALFSRMATPRGGMAPFAGPKIVWRPLVSNADAWRKHLQSNRDVIRAEWAAGTGLREWIVGLDAFEFIGDNTTSYAGLPQVYAALRTARDLHSAYASLLALEGRGDEALAVLTPLLSVGYELQPPARTLVRYMVAVSTQSVAQDTVRFVLTHANPSPATPRTRAAEGGIHR
jgi:hypothetical protein